MPLNKEDKKSIIKYRVEKAHKTMIEARDCATMGHWTLAANRFSMTFVAENQPYNKITVQLSVKEKRE